MHSPYQSPVQRLWFWLHRIICALVLLFLVLPVLVIAPLSFTSSTLLIYPIPEFSLAEWMRSVKNSLIVAPAATLIATVLGILAAIGLTRGEFRGKALIMSLVISPMVVLSGFRPARFWQQLFFADSHARGAGCAFCHYYRLSDFARF